MKKSQLRKLVSEYRELLAKHHPKKEQRLTEIKQRYFHETGQELK
jgi:hypothetical protein